MGCHIGYSHQASNTRAFALLAEGWNDLVQEGLTPDLMGTCPVSSASEVLYAVSQDSDIVGVLTWEHHRDWGVFEVTLGYVEPSSRKQGVFSALYGALLDAARKAGASSIRFQLHPANTVARAVLLKRKGQVASVLYEHPVA